MTARRTPAIDTPAPDRRLTAALRARGQRVTPQRLLIHRALHDLGRHATAEQVLSQVSRELPGASLPTVYATLDLLEELGIVRRVTPGPGPALYDPRPDDHQHVVCRTCGKVEDVDVALDAAKALETVRRRGFRPDRAELVVSGVCAECAAGGG